MLSPDAIEYFSEGSHRLGKQPRSGDAARRPAAEQVRLQRGEAVVGLRHLADHLGDAPLPFPGEGEGHIERIMAEAVKRGYRGFAVMEPHLLGGGPTGGVTGPELFPQAVAAYKRILDKVGAQYQ